MVQLAQAGRVTEARETLVEYLEDHPGEGTMLYNLACLDLLLNDHDRALADLESALTNGYTNFRLIDNDRSLNPLRDDPRFQDLVSRHEAVFRDMYFLRALTLEDGYSVEDVPLHAGPEPTPGVVGPRADLTLSFDREAFTIAATVVDPGGLLDELPWDGGSGLLINLVRPISPDDYESQRYHSVGIGAVDEDPRTYLVGHDGEVLMRRLPEITPVVERNGDMLRFKVALPWDLFHPYGPPLDQEMGLNVFYLGAGGSADRSILSLMPEGRLSYEQEPWRRFVPISFWTSDRTRPVMKGRLYDRMIEGETVDLEYVLWSEDGATRTCRFEVLNNDGSPIEGAGDVVRELVCEEGLNFFDDSLDVSDLPTGKYRLRASLEDEDGGAMTVEESFSRFEDDWLESLNVRIYDMENPESEILRYRLFVLARELDRRHPQDPTAHVHDIYDDLVGMIETCEAGGSCLPNAGVFTGGFSVDTMTQRLCMMHLPSGYREQERLRLLVVVPPSPGVEEQTAADLGASLGADAGTIVLVPQSHGNTGLAVDKASRQTEMAVSWARNLFHSDDVTLVGLGAGADAALAAGLEHPELYRRVILCADHLFLEDDRFSVDHLRTALTGRNTDLPYTLVTRLIAGDRLATIETTMRELGYRVDVVSVPEGAGDGEWIAGLLDREASD